MSTNGRRPRVFNLWPQGKAQMQDLTKSKTSIQDLNSRFHWWILMWYLSILLISVMIRPQKSQYKESKYVKNEENGLKNGPFWGLSRRYKIMLLDSMKGNQSHLSFAKCDIVFQADQSQMSTSIVLIWRIVWKLSWKR